MNGFFAKYLICAVKRVIYKFINIKRHVILQPGANIVRGTKFEGYNYIGSSSIFQGTIGYGSYIGDNCDVNATIGRFSCIAGSTKIVNGFHPTKDYVSIHPAFFSDMHKGLLSFGINNSFKEFRYFDEEREIWVDIGNDVWIGSNVLILSGIKIGDGAVVAAGDVVVKDIEPYSIYGGVPAKKIGQRFPDETIRKLNDIKWWNMPLEWIENNAEYFSDIDLFIEMANKEIESDSQS